MVRAKFGIKGSVNVDPTETETRIVRQGSGVVPPKVNNPRLIPAGHEQIERGGRIGSLLYFLPTGVSVSV
jgi:hypothetical protein